MALFGSDFLTRLEYLSIVSRRVFRGQLMAQRRTMLSGAGVEFADHRQYAAGDDFRYLDWNLYARHDELLLKRFQEEEDLHVYLLTDCSRSMSTGVVPRFDLARQIAAALAYIALADLDRVSAVAFADSITARFSLTRGKDQILSVMKFLESLQPDASDTNLASVTREFVMQAPRKGLVVVLSDLLDRTGFREGLDVLRHQGFETHVVQILDETDLAPDILGDVELMDVESGEVRNLTVTESLLENYQSRFRAFLEDVREYCGHYGVGYTLTDSSAAFDDVVLGMLNIRSR